MWKKDARIDTWIVCIFIVVSACLVTPAQTPKDSQAVDFSALVGKSPEDLEKILGKKPHRVYRDTRLEPWCDEARHYKIGPLLWVGFRHNRAVVLSFLFKRGQFAPTPEAALLAVGIDVGGIPPDQTAQRPPYGPTEPLGILLRDKVFKMQEKNSLWFGSFNGVQWEWLWVCGFESRFHGPEWRKESWQVKPRYFMVMAYFVDKAH